MNTPSVLPLKSVPSGATHTFLERLALIDKILDISEAMFEDAKASAWEKLCEREALRQPLIWQFSEFPVTDTERDQWHSQLARIQHINHRLTEMARFEREKIAQQLGKLRKGNRMTNSYQGSTSHCAPSV